MSRQRRTPPPAHRSALAFPPFLEDSMKKVICVVSAAFLTA